MGDETVVYHQTAIRVLAKGDERVVKVTSSTRYVYTKPKRCCKPPVMVHYPSPRRALAFGLRAQGKKQLWLAQVASWASYFRTLIRHFFKQVRKEHRYFHEAGSGQGDSFWALWAKILGSAPRQVIACHTWVCVTRFFLVST